LHRIQQQSRYFHKTGLRSTIQWNRPPTPGRFYH
jgi:hypothetical protein